MSSEPYVPTEGDIIGCWARAAQRAGRDSYVAMAECQRGVAKIKADALREAAERARAAILDPSPSEAPYYHGARYGQRKFADWLDYRADEIEGEA